MRQILPFRRPRRISRLKIREVLMTVAIFIGVFVANFALDEETRSNLGSVAARILPVTSAEISGTVTHVRDGDTIEVDGLPIRLNGLSAPERDEPYGKAATDFMRSLVFGKVLRCELNGEQTYDRKVGICYLDGADISALIIREGLARDCPRYSGGRYAADERQAKRTGLHQTYRLPGYCR